MISILCRKLVTNSVGSLPMEDQELFEFPRVGLFLEQQLSFRCLCPLTCRFFHKFSSSFWNSDRVLEEHCQLKGLVIMLFFFLRHFPGQLESLERH